MKGNMRRRLRKAARAFAASVAAACALSGGVSSVYANQPNYSIPAGEIKTALASYRTSLTSAQVAELRKHKWASGTVDGQGLSGSLTIRKVNSGSWQNDAWFESKGRSENTGSHEMFTVDVTSGPLSFMKGIATACCVIPGAVSPSSGTSMNIDSSLATGKRRSVITVSGNTVTVTVRAGVSESRASDVNHSGTQDVGFWFRFTTETPKGKITLTKKDASTGKAIKKSSATFEVLNKSGSVAATVSTGSNGMATTGDLPVSGNPYTIREKAAPSGYSKSSATLTANVVSGKTVNAGAISDSEPLGSVLLRKKDQATGKSEAQTPEATLKGAVFELKAAEDIADAADGSVLYKKGSTVKQIVTDANGAGKATGLHFGKYTLHEATAPTGYNAAGDVSVTVSKTADIEVSVPERIISAPVSLEKFKKDEASEDILKRLTGAQFTIYYDANANGAIDSGEKPAAADATGKALGVQTTDKEGSFVTPRLPYGHYVMRETKTPKGLKAVKDIAFFIKTDSQNATEKYEALDQKFKGKLKIVKKDADTGMEVTLTGATFRIMKSDGTYVSQKVGSGSYDRFTTNSDGFAEMDVSEVGFIDRLASLGTTVLPLELDEGTYTLTEIKTPEGYLELENAVKFTIDADEEHETDRSGSAVFAVTAVNRQPKGELSIEKKIQGQEGADLKIGASLTKVRFSLTAAEDIKDMRTGAVIYKKGERAWFLNGVPASSGTAGAIDYIQCGADGKASVSKLWMGKYVLKEIQTDPGLVVSDKEYEVSFTKKDSKQKVYSESETAVNVPTETLFDKRDEKGNRLDGAKLKVTDAEGKTVAEWTTKANAGYRIEGLSREQVYTLSEESAPEGWLKADDVQFTPDASGETLSIVMSDPREPIEIRTEAKDEQSGDGWGEMRENGEKAVVSDTVSYSGLVTNRGWKYRIEGTLMNKKTGAPVSNDGKTPVTAELEFSPEEGKRDGEAVLEFEADAEKLKGTDTVVYEKLYEIRSGENEPDEAACHEDIEDEGQTVRWPDLHTTASDSETGAHAGAASEKAVIKDEVKYSGLKPGQKYTVKGTLHDRDTGEALKDGEGKEITAEKEFTAEKAEGNVTLEYILDASKLAGRTAVVFEDLYRDERKVISHADVSDEEQSVSYPKIGTKATADGKKEVTASGNVTVEDEVSYSGVPKGEYILKGTLMDKSTGKELAGTAGSEAKLEAKKESGTATMKFTVSAAALKKNTAIVVFEDLYAKTEDGKEVLVASHADINDEGQTVTIRKPKPTAKKQKKQPKTGDGSGTEAALAACAASLALALMMARRLRRKAE